MAHTTHDLDRLFAGARTVLLVHAHPDDETLATGGLVVELVTRGVEVVLLTATRGEQGEVVPGSVPSGAPSLSAHREAELAAACAALGIHRHAFLGQPPARAAGLPPRIYTDSGMRWVDEAQTVAGPGEAAEGDALSLANPQEISADIAAAGRAAGADVVVSYDAFGGYGHPDHVALHNPSRAAAHALGSRFIEVASEVDQETPTLDAREHLPQVKAALACHASQVTVDGDEVVHVGGQRQPIMLRHTLREA